MNEMILPFLVAITVILLIVGLYQIVGGLSDERKRIQQRLSGEGKAAEGFDPATLTVMRREQVIGGLSGGDRRYRQVGDTRRRQSLLDLGVGSEGDRPLFQEEVRLHVRRR